MSLIETQISQAFAAYDTRQRGWLPESQARTLLETAIFARRADKQYIVNSAMVDMLAAAKNDTELQRTPTSCTETRIPAAAFVAAVTPKVAAAGSAEEVQAAFNALGACQTTQVLARSVFVDSATSADSFIVEGAAVGAWRIVSGGAAEKDMDFQSFRSNMNEVIHSTKVPSKA